MTQNMGMSATTGAPLAGNKHIRQSIRDILTTPIGTRVELREYGSNLPRLVDRPMNQLFLVDLIAETAGALKRWEPRFKTTAIRIEGVLESGRISITVEGYSIIDGEFVRLEGIVV